MGKRQTIRDAVTDRRHQRGGALIVMLVVLVLGASWLYIDAFRPGSNQTTIIHRKETAAVLSQAKLALMGWVATKAAAAGENNPGRVPCPEAAGYFGTSYEGIAAGNCTLPAIGRLPWRTLGLSKLVDASGEPLWYVVSPGVPQPLIPTLPPGELVGPWALDSAPSTLYINSYSRGWLTLDGAANAAVALVIAPGPPLKISPPALPLGGCAAPVQTRNDLVAPDFRDYLECENAINPPETDPLDVDYAKFVTRGPENYFNDQVLAVTTRDVLPIIEAAIAGRIKREIVPALKSVYGSNFNVSAATPVYPYAAPFGDPGPGTGTSSYLGDAATYQGLLPFNQTQNCTVSASNPRCLPDLVEWSVVPVIYQSGGSGSFLGPTCTWEGPAYPLANARACDKTYLETPEISMLQMFGNVALGLRALDTTKIHLDVYDDVLFAFVPTIPTQTSVTLNATGTATLSVRHQLPASTAGAFRIRVERTAIGDHALLNENDATTGWFVRNDWYRLLYYAVAEGQTAAKLASLPCAPGVGTNCLSVTSAGVQENDKRALVLLAGRSLSNQTRPSAALTDFLDTPENNDPSYPSGSATPELFEQPHINYSSANDRVIVVDQN